MSSNPRAPAMGWLLAPVVCALSALTAAQVPGTFRSRVTLVPVDVRVVDQKGRAVTDLTQADFTVFEDGVRQEIGQFARLSLVAAAPQADTPPALRRLPGPELAPPQHRVFLIVLGRGRLQGPSKGVDAAVAFVRDRLLPQDQAAVLAFNRATDFTTDHAKILKILERFRDRHDALDASLRQRLGGLAGVYGRTPREVQKEIDTIFYGDGLPRSRELPPGRITDAGRFELDQQSDYQALDPTDAGFDEYVYTRMGSVRDLENVYGGIDYLRYIDGEKHLIFVTEFGLFVPRVEDDKSVAAMAADARVAVHTIQTGGVFGDRPGARRLSQEAWDRTAAVRTLRNISDLTGGHASIFSSAAEAIERIDETTRGGYLLGYYPLRQSADGGYRRIHVRVNRPGATALYRHGYYDRQQLVPFDRRQFLAFSRVSAAMNFQQPLSDVRISLTAAADKAAAGPGDVTVRLLVDAAKVGFAGTADLATVALDVAIFWGESRDRLGGQMWQKIDLRLNPDQKARLLKDGIRYTVNLPAGERARAVKAVVYDYHADLLGSAFAKVQ